MSKHGKSNSVRIIAGLWRGRRLPVINSAGLRPSTDRVRETLFNWLMYDIQAARCLDLFAGSGALGLESLSRGAQFVQFVECNAEVAELLRESLNLWPNDGQNCYHLLQSDALSFLQQPPSLTYDVVFLDPPFKSKLLQPVITLLEDNAWLAERSVIYVEQSVKRQPIQLPSNWA